MFDKIINGLMKSAAIIWWIFLDLVGLIIIVITASYFLHALGVW
jgi:hypothetical protein